MNLVKIYAFLFLILGFSIVSAQDRIITENTSTSTVNSNNLNVTTVKNSPPSVISPCITVINNDFCTVGISEVSREIYRYNTIRNNIRAQRALSERSNAVHKEIIDKQYII